MRFITLVVVLSFSVSAVSSTQSGQITGYIPYSSGDKEIIVFKLKNNVVKGCKTTGRLAIDSRSLRYRATVAAVMSAFHSQTPIVVKYLPGCHS